MSIIGTPSPGSPSPGSPSPSLAKIPTPESPNPCLATGAPQAKLGLGVPSGVIPLQQVTEHE